MIKSFILFTALALISCSGKTTKQAIKTSYWQSLKDSFVTRNLTEFVVDSQLENSYKSFHAIRNNVIDSAIHYGTPYLYSWQESNAGFTEFTILVDDVEHGRRIVYFIFDASDSLRSVTHVAYKGGEGGITYESRSRFIAKDTLLAIRSATTIWDLNKQELTKLSRPKGDSTFFHLTILNDGSVVKKQFAEKKELNLE